MTAIQCEHPDGSLLLLASNIAYNKDRQSEQREFRKVGEVFTMMFQHTCGICGETVYKELKLKKTS